MRLVIQRAHHGKVTVDGATVGEISKGLVCLIGLEPNDTTFEQDWAVRKMLVRRECLHSMPKIANTMQECIS